MSGIDLEDVLANKNLNSELSKHEEISTRQEFLDEEGYFHQDYETFYPDTQFGRKQMVEDCIGGKEVHKRMGYVNLDDVNTYALLSAIINNEEIEYTDIFSSLKWGTRGEFL